MIKRCIQKKAFIYLKALVWNVQFHLWKVPGNFHGVGLKERMKINWDFQRSGGGVSVMVFTFNEEYESNTCSSFVFPGNIHDIRVPLPGTSATDFQVKETGKKKKGDDKNINWNLQVHSSFT